MNEWPISVDYESEIKSLHPDFVFKERDRMSWGGIVFSIGISSVYSYDDFSLLFRLCCY